MSKQQQPNKTWLKPRWTHDQTDNQGRVSELGHVSYKQLTFLGQRNGHRPFKIRLMGM